MQFAAGRDVEVEAFLGDEPSHRGTQKRLARVGDTVEVGAVLATARPEFEFVVHVQRGAELGREVDKVDTADGETSVVGDARRRGEQRQIERRVLTHQSSDSSSSSRRAISSGALTPSRPSAFASPTRHASDSHSRACVRSASSVITRQSR